MEENKNLAKMLERERIPYRKNLKLKNITYSSTGNNVDYYIQPISKQQLVLLIQELNKLKIKFLICGGTTNLLFLDFIDYGCIVNTSLLSDFSIDESGITVSSGVELSKFVRLCLIHGCIGFEGLEGIPGSIGGAVFQNAGAYGYLISDLIVRVRCCDYNGNLLTLTKENCDFRKRSSIFQSKDYIILDIEFKIKKGDIHQAEKKIEMFHIARHSYQEWVYPNLGSVFVTDTNVYDSFSKKNILYKIILFMIKLISNNPIYKRWFRKSPSNKLKNLATQKLITDKISPHIYSHKSINTFTNRNNKSIDIVKYYFEMFLHLGDDAKLENEIVFSSISRIINKPDYDEFNSIISKNEKIKNKIK